VVDDWEDDFEMEETTKTKLLLPPTKKRRR
jgi:hypothetical protein